MEGEEGTSNLAFQILAAIQETNISSLGDPGLALWRSLIVSRRLVARFNPCSRGPLAKTLRMGVPRVALLEGFDIRDKIEVLNYPAVEIHQLLGIRGHVSRVTRQGEIVLVILPVVVDSPVEVLKGVGHVKTMVVLHKVVVLGLATRVMSLRQGLRLVVVAFLVEILLPVAAASLMVFLEADFPVDLLEAFLAVVGQGVDVQVVVAIPVFLEGVILAVLAVVILGSLLLAFRRGLEA